MSEVAWQTVSAALVNADWILWNAFLAVVPLALAFTLFRVPRRHTRAWWLGVAAFVAFLPNAPYVLTDVKHFVHQVRDSAATVPVVFGLMPAFAALFAVGVTAYVGSLLLVRDALRRAGRGHLSTRVEIALHAASAIGIYLGRVERLNSWDVLAEPGRLLVAVAGTLDAWPLAFVAVTFAVLLAVHAAATNLLSAFGRPRTLR